MEDCDTVHLGVITNCSASLLAPTHTYPGFTYLESKISSLNSNAGTMLDIYNDMSLMRNKNQPDKKERKKKFIINIVFLFHIDAYLQP